MKTQGILFCLYTLSSLSLCLGQTRDQMAIWNFNGASGTFNPNVTTEVLNGTPVLTRAGGQPIGGTHVVGTGFNDIEGVVHAAGRAASWTDVKVNLPNVNASWEVALDTRGWRSIVVRFSYLGNATTPIQGVDVEYSVNDGASWQTHLNNSPLTGNDATWRGVEFAVFPAVVDNRSGVRFRFRDLEQGTGNNQFAFDNFEIQGFPIAPNLVLNEIKINPPGDVADNPSRPDSGWEYIELKGVPGHDLANHRVIVLNGSDGETGIDRGVATLVVPLSGTVPASGIVQIRQAGHLVPSSALGILVQPAHRIPAGAGNPNDELMVNQCSTVLLAMGGTAPAVGTVDYDTGNNGALDQGTWHVLNQTILDGIAWNGDDVDDVVYWIPSLVLRQTAGVPDAATRYPGNMTMNQLEAWFSGSLDDHTGGAQALGYSADPNERSGQGMLNTQTFPAGAANSIFLTPAVPNEPNTASTIGVIGPQSWVVRDQNPAIGFSLNGVSSIVAFSSDTSVANPGANITLQWSGASGSVAINPYRMGFNVVITLLPNNNWAAARSFPIAALVGGNHMKFHGGVSDGSTAVRIGGYIGGYPAPEPATELMIHGDDESDLMRIYNRYHTGVRLGGTPFDPRPWLSLDPSDRPEIDYEASTTVMEGTIRVIYWLGGHGNGPADQGAHLLPNRDRLFATTLTESADPYLVQLAFGDTTRNARAYNRTFRTALSSWHPEFRLAESMAEGVDPKQPYGFNIEGLAAPPEGDTFYIGFRAPLLPAPASGPINSSPELRRFALLAPFTNFRDLITGALGSANPTMPNLGNPIQLDLGGRGIRSMDWTHFAMSIVAGPPTDSVYRGPGEFAIFRWHPGYSLLEEWMADLTGKNIEGIIELPDFDGIFPLRRMYVLEDNGTYDWYGVGVQSKHFPLESWGAYRRTRSSMLRFGQRIGAPYTYTFALIGNGINPSSAARSEGFAIAVRHRVGWSDIPSQVVGQSDGVASGTHHAFFTEYSSGPTAALAPLNSTAPNSAAVAMMYDEDHGSNGKAVGYSFDGNMPPNSRAIVWDLQTLTIERVIPTLPGGAQNEASGVATNFYAYSAGRHVVGSSTKTGGTGAFLWTESNPTAVSELPGLPGATYSVANSINNFGQIVGASGASSASKTACLWEHNGYVWSPVVSLGTLPNGGTSEALFINDNGTIVGYAYTTPANTVKRACLWARLASTYQIYDLGVHPNFPSGNSEARCISEAGQVVGWAQFNATETHGVTWLNGRFHDLNVLAPNGGGIFINANAVSNKGDITGGWVQALGGVVKAYYIYGYYTDD